MVRQESVVCREQGDTYKCRVRNEDGSIEVRNDVTAVRSTGNNDVESTPSEVTVRANDGMRCSLDGDHQILCS